MSRLISTNLLFYLKWQRWRRRGNLSLHKERVEEEEKNRFAQTSFSIISALRCIVYGRGEKMFSEYPMFNPWPYVRL